MVDVVIGGTTNLRFTRARMLAASVTLAGLLALGCRGQETLGLPDSYLVYAPVFDKDGAALKSRAGLPLADELPLDDERAAPLHKQIGLGIVGEMLRTDYLAKQLVRDLAVDGKRYAEPARAAAREPTVFLMGRGLPPLATGLATKGFFGGAAEHPGVAWVGLKEDLSGDRALPQSLTSLLGRQVLARVVDTAPPVLVDGYVGAMEVIAREWRVGEGPQGAVSFDAGTGTQRALFAGVRDNKFAVGPDGAPRAPQEQLADPGLAATVLYRMAQSKAVGRHVAPADVYAPFVSDRVPPGVSPAAVLGPFRNFQVKLLTAWARAALAGNPPRDIIDLVEAYGRAMPAERAEAYRIFVVTTYGATVKPGGVNTTGAHAAQALPELTALAAEVAAGRRSPRAALAPAAQP